MKLTEQEIEDAKSPNGGWSRETLASWGVPWPPPKGWKKKLVAGEPFPQPDIPKKSKRQKHREQRAKNILRYRKTLARKAEAERELERINDNLDDVFKSTIQG